MEQVPVPTSKLEKHAQLIKSMDDLAFEIGKIKFQAHFAHLRPNSGVENDKNSVDLNGKFDD